MSLFGPPNVEKMKAKKDVNGLIKALSYTKDATIREAAASALGEIGEPRAVEPLIVVLNDRDWEKREENRPVRCAAALALGRIGDPRAVGPLAEALSDYESAVRGPARDALIEIGDPSAVEPVIAVMHTLVNLDNAITVLCALGKPAVEPLTTFLDDEETNVRHAVAYVLGEIGDPHAVGSLIQTLKDEKEHVRTRAAKSLGKIGDARAVDPLILALQDEWRDLRHAAAEALGIIGDPRAVDSLIRTLQQNKDAKVCAGAARSLGKLGDARAAKPLIAALPTHTWHKDFRKAVIEALVLIGNPAVEPLSIALQDEKADIRQGAAEVLGKIGTPEAREALLKENDQWGSMDKERRRPAPKLPSGLPGPMPKHELVSSSNLKEGPGPGGSEFQTALGYWNAGRYDQAAEHYFKAIELGLTSVYEAASRSNLGKIYLMQEDVEAAVDQFLKGLYLSPLTASTAYSCSSHLALIYEELGMTDDMLATVEVAEVTLKQIDSIMSAEAASKARATVRRVYG
jgi:HEAT repeat protein